MALDTFNPYLFVSSGEQSNKFLTPTYVDGIAQFQAQRAQMLTKLLVQIDPVQDLHGQSNPYPAGGGKNLLPPFSSYSGNGLTTTANSDGSITITGTATGTGGYLTDFVNIAKTVASGTTVAFSTKNNVPEKLRVFYDNGTADIAANGNKIVFPCQSDVTKLRLYLFTTAGTTYNFTIYPQFEIGSTATDWSPYSNICPISGRTGLTVTVQSGETQNEYPVTWESIAGTVYGGTLDVVSGELTIDRIFETVDGARIESAIKEGTIWRVTPYPQLTPSGREYIDGISNIYPWATSWSAMGGMAIGVAINSSRGGQFLIRDDSLTSLADFKERFNETPLQLCYELATPLEPIQLTPTEVRTIAGFNQIYSDAGPVIDIKF